jgi:hypothetical protein
MKSAKIAVSVPKELFDEVERDRKRRGLTRSAVVQIGLRAWLKARGDEEKVAKYVRSFREFPETEAEAEDGGLITVASISKDRRR